MAGVAIEVDDSELKRLNQRLSRYLQKLARPAEAMGIASTFLESQTRRRIQEEKTDPDGRMWQEWSERYRKTRHANQSLLVSRGQMLDDIANEAGTDFAAVFTSMIYGPTHQFGDDSRNIPARPYLGMSRANATQIEAEVADWMESAL